MSVQAVTHLNLRGQARAALHHYQAVFGGEISVATYRDAGNVREPGDADLVMWGQVAAANGFRIMAFDVPAGQAWHPGDNAFAVSVRGDTAAEIESLWTGLADGAQIVQALAPAPWTPLYGMLKDRFGVTWMLDVARS